LIVCRVVDNEVVLGVSEYVVEDVVARLRLGLRAGVQIPDGVQVPRVRLGLLLGLGVLLGLGLEL
jgi:hypothetical protein